MGALVQCALIEVPPLCVSKTFFYINLRSHNINMNFTHAILYLRCCFYIHEISAPFSWDLFIGNVSLKYIVRKHFQIVIPCYHFLISWKKYKGSKKTYLRKYLCFLYYFYRLTFIRYFDIHTVFSCLLKHLVLLNNIITNFIIFSGN